MPAQAMQIEDRSTTEIVAEFDVYSALLPLDDARIIELGCGDAAHTRALADTGRPAAITACEVDTVQHEKNLAIDDLPRVRFVHCGAEAIPADDASADIVMMFKSLHHVPVESMDTAMHEIARVLRPGGLAYISEPVYAGDFNAILRLFHDERVVREAAFAAIRRAVEAGILELVEERFFQVRNDFADFADFEQRVLGVTHTEHNLSPQLHAEVRERFEAHQEADGAHFLMPMRVDLLRRPIDP